MNCKDCLHEKICYMREICNDVEEEIKRFGCMNFVDCANVREVKDGWEWKASCKGEGDAQMSDYIDRDELIKHIKDLPTWWGDGSGVYTFYPVEVMVSIGNAPAADVQEVRHGEWIKDDSDGCYCSACEWYADYDYDYVTNYGLGNDDFIYCPHCGAKMDGGEE